MYVDWTVTGFNETKGANHGEVVGIVVGTDAVGPNLLATDFSEYPFYTNPWYELHPQ